MTELISTTFNEHLNELGSDNVMLVQLFYNHAIMRYKSYTE